MKNYVLPADIHLDEKSIAELGLEEAPPDHGPSLEEEGPEHE
jgi:hypothetical protein